jgi:DNA polymerase-3 subunit alpha
LDLKEDNKEKRNIVYQCAKNFSSKVPKGKEKEYRERIKQEIEVFKMKGLSSYMLIVADYVNEAKRRNIPVGPGRGSVGGSLVAHLIGIHDADPIKYGLIFERFYNRDKTGLSDIDCDFSQKGKPEIEEYIVNKYGKEMCAQISNYAQLTPKQYARRISGAYLYGGDHKSAVAIGNAIAESIPKDIHSVTQALNDAPLFAEYAKTEKYKHLGLLAEHLGNKNYNLSVHAGALIIGKRPLADIVPVRISKDGVVATEYEKDRAEANGLAKMDILGLSTLDIIQDTYELIRKRGKLLPSLPWDYDQNDSLTYDLISKGNTLCVFQFGKSAGTIELCKKIHPRNIEELAMINALTRPGVPKEAREEFILAKNSGKKVQLLHPSLERAFAPTYGVAVFEECLMFLAQDVAGWDFNQADKLRKFVKDKGKDPEKGKKLRTEFVDFAVRVKKIPQEMAERIWDEIVANFASYAFNKSHAILYSFIAYQTAYLKAHYPLEFLTANLIFESNSNALDSEETILAIKGEIRALNLKYFDQASQTSKIGKVKIVPPSINKSETTYTIIDDRTLLTGFDSLKYMGKDGIPEILAQRPFTNLSDFLMKVDGRKVRSPAVQALAASGSLDEFGMTRQLIYLYARDYKQKHSLWQKRKNKTDHFDYP